ncbi:zinc-ribbon domain-containing protein [Methanobrevibacter olleyae]|uniref:Zinc-ribbon domain-containing protein n=1 Tax=Methanobrevibacter olleyae TaxID=294671 RepID=A0A1I4HL29_METOL|nr:zinc ribbon domain-containing protein [Methanobrevibacter olleyae]SFL42417.1 zinc-ribbon domain-containing protein [Methanobrevibacter olleyae]
MVFCSNCSAENNDSAKFCKECGNPLNTSGSIKNNYITTGNAPSAGINDNSNLNNSNKSINSDSSKSINKNLIIICLTIVICAILIAGALTLFSNDDNSNGDSNLLSDSASLNATGSADNSLNNLNDSRSTDSNPVETSTQTTHSSSPRILSGSFSTGSSSSDKTYCNLYLGSEHGGKKVKISVLYSNNGHALNQGKIVSKTVNSDGYVKLASASAFDYYPDDAYITLYDSDGNILDRKEVYLYEDSGIQRF